MGETAAGWAAPSEVVARAFSAGDKPSWSVFTRVLLLGTTVWDLGPWLPVRPCPKAMAVRPICCPMIVLFWCAAFSLVVGTPRRLTEGKKNRHG